MAPSRGPKDRHHACRASRIAHTRRHREGQGPLRDFPEQLDVARQRWGVHDYVRALAQTVCTRCSRSRTGIPDLGHSVHTVIIAPHATGRPKTTPNAPTDHLNRVQQAVIRSPDHPRGDVRVWRPAMSVIGLESSSRCVFVLGHRERSGRTPPTDATRALAWRPRPGQLVYRTASCDVLQRPTAGDTGRHGWRLQDATIGFLPNDVRGP